MSGNYLYMREIRKNIEKINYSTHKKNPGDLENGHELCRDVM
jgi:hypothetical protein